MNVTHFIAYYDRVYRQDMGIWMTSLFQANPIPNPPYPLGNPTYISDSGEFESSLASSDEMFLNWQKRSYKMGFHLKITCLIPVMCHPYDVQPLSLGTSVSFFTIFFVTVF